MQLYLIKMSIAMPFLSIKNYVALITSFVIYLLVVYLNLVKEEVPVLK